MSNLPTVWSNVLAGVALSERDASRATLAALCAILSLFYVAGMMLNDAFDRAADTRERPERPIPAGHVRTGTVFIVGATLLAAGIALLALRSAASAKVGVALAVTIVIYDAWHKQNPLAPLLMGACRALVYLAAAVSVGWVHVGGFALPAGCAAVAVYVACLTAVSSSGASARVVAVLIAGISLVDAGFAALAIEPQLAACAALGFPLTLLGQRWVRGT